MINKKTKRQLPVSIYGTLRVRVSDAALLYTKKYARDKLFEIIFENNRCLRVAFDHDIGSCLAMLGLSL